MKKLAFIIFFATLSLNVFAQDKASFTFDYEVDYEVSNKRKGKDTLTIAFDKSGRYLWTNHSKLAELIRKDISQVTAAGISTMNTHIIYDTQSNQMYIRFSNEELSMFMKLSLADFLPTTRKIFNESFDLIVEKTSKTTKVMEKTYPVYHMYPDLEKYKDDKLHIVFDKKSPVNNNAMFSGLSKIMTDEKNTVGINFPNGLIMKVGKSGSTFIEAVAVRKISRTITINNTLDIKE